MKNFLQITKYSLTFLRETKNLVQANSDIDFPKILKWFYPWIKSNIDGSSPLEDAIPWITFSAIEFLDQYTDDGMNIFEYGTGGSTAFFLSKGANVFSVEHDETWANEICQKLSENSENWILTLRKPQKISDFSSRSPSEPNDFISNSLSYSGLSFMEYANEIKRYPDAFFDIVLIDGRARPSCFIAALSKVKKGGIIVWDNTDRETYWKAITMSPKQLKLLEFPGPSPYVDFFTKTSVWLNQL
jgi:hypothetical protein